MVKRPRRRRIVNIRYAKSDLDTLPWFDSLFKTSKSFHGQSCRSKAFDIQMLTRRKSRRLKEHKALLRAVIASKSALVLFVAAEKPVDDVNCRNNLTYLRHYIAARDCAKFSRATTSTTGASLTNLNIGVVNVLQTRGLDCLFGGGPVKNSIRCNKIPAVRFSELVLVRKELFGIISKQSSTTTSLNAAIVEHLHITNLVRTMISRSAIGRNAQLALRRQCCAQPANRRGLAAAVSGSTSFSYETTDVGGVKVASRDVSGPTTKLAVVAKAGTRYQSAPGLTVGLEQFAFKVRMSALDCRLLSDSILSRTPTNDQHYELRESLSF